MYAQDSPSEDPDAEPSPTPQASPSTSLEHRFLKNIIQDQRAIWTAPFSLHHSDVNWIAPLSVSSAILFATDRRSAGEMTEPGNHRTRLRISADISQGGSFFPVSAIAGTFYLVGRTTHDSRARETGLLSMEALLDSGLVTSALKVASQRPRPNVDDASGEFYDKGSSFPSGHAASAWSVATVIASEYGPHRPLVLVATYGLATAVSMSRYTGQNHFLSDVLAGSAIGYGIGRYVYRAHHDSLVDQADGPTRHSKLKSKLIPFTFPVYNAAQRTYGLALSWPL
ncbi:MAG TPA: phosphatase PAP2 family protein [Pyrinomonadaceae bacterium]|nr:phosphatase PAP2 family protein [Pyrinomonadaceae bacterium]